MAVKIVCPRCDGQGEVPTGGASPYVRNFETCPMCSGAKTIEGELAPGEWERMHPVTFGAGAPAAGPVQRPPSQGSAEEFCEGRDGLDPLASPN